VLKLQGGCINGQSRTDFDTLDAHGKVLGEMATLNTTELHVDGMTCNNCARHVTEAIQSTAGVQSATVSLANKSATVRWNSPDVKNISAILTGISQAGYAAQEIHPDSNTGEASDRWQWTLILGITVTILLMTGEWAFGLMMTPWFEWSAFALASVVQVFCGAPFYRGAWNQLKHGHSNMDTLVALGSTTAFGYSAWALLSGAGGHLYFMEAAAIISLISFGHWLEARVSDRASGTLKSLLNLAPPTARKLQRPATDAPQQPLNLKTLAFSPVETEIEIPVAGLAIDDHIVLRPGDRVPVDGTVTDGDSSVDESMLTGESIPLHKKDGSELFAGTMNLNGRLVMRVTATGETTALAQVIAAVQRAQTSRADIQRLGDRISGIFVPIVVSLALAAGLWWGLAPASATAVHHALTAIFWHSQLPSGAAAGFIIAAAVLIVACPCAMGLATPVAIMAGANAAARRGILIRDGVALEKAGKITTVIFDKTGTLTVGRPELAAEKEFGSAQPSGKTLAATLAHNSTHPISQALAKLSAQKIELTDWREIRGSGVSATIPPSIPGTQPSTARLGSLVWLRENGVDLAAGESFMAEWSAQGAIVVGLASGKNLLGLFAVHDQIKTGAAKVVARLQQQNLKTFLVTGDNTLTATSIARQVGIPSENVFAQIRPEQKAEFVKKLQARGERVAFVGDGINDAPALTQSDLGIAVSRASDIARGAADIILLKSEIEAVPESLALARATLRTIKQNLFWAFFYNALGVPLAALGFISPVFCAAAMGFSDLIVIGNALRLLRWRSRP
jgi:Cu+-exporting ATPase